MGKDVEYCNDKGTKAHENSNQVHYEACGQQQKYEKNDHCKQMEEKHRTKYVTGCGAQQAICAGSSRSERHRSAWGSARPESHRSASKVCASKPESSHCSKKTTLYQCSPPKSQRCPPKPQCCPPKPQCSPKKPELTMVQRMARCYEVKPAQRRDPCTRKPCWQHGKYVRDECGSGIVPKRLLFLPNRQVWCKTPLSMYQATIGELARKILCREIHMPRDVKGEPPSNIAEYIMPPCRGYYRKYDCLRPCEEDYAVVQGGKKIYRDRVERHWEPCLSEGQKHQININDFAPHNAYLTLKLRRQNIAEDELCW